MKETEKPKIIYKYQSFDTQSLQNLKKSCIYFGSPLNFNDPYDCAITADIKEPTDEDVCKAHQQCIEDPNTPHSIRKELIKSMEEGNNQRNKEMYTRIGENTIYDRINDFLKKKGVSCFSAENDNLLMWAHYGGGYKGFCLKFSTEFMPFSEIKEIEYHVDMPIVDYMYALINDDYKEIVKKLYHTKSKDWEYEKEWRIIHNDVGTEYYYDQKALKAVYFGPKMETASMEIICLILLGQNPDVEFYQGNRSKTKFKVEFEKFDYTTHIDAKKRGLIK